MKTLLNKTISAVNRVNNKLVTNSEKVYENWAANRRMSI